MVNYIYLLEFLFDKHDEFQKKINESKQKIICLEAEKKATREVLVNKSDELQQVNKTMELIEQ